MVWTHRHPGASACFCQSNNSVRVLNLYHIHLYIYIICIYIYITDFDYILNYILYMCLFSSVQQRSQGNGQLLCESWVESMIAWLDWNSMILISLNSMHNIWHTHVILSHWCTQGQQWWCHITEWKVVFCQDLGIQAKVFCAWLCHQPLSAQWQFWRLPEGQRRRSLEWMFLLGSTCGMKIWPHFFYPWS